MMIKYFILRLKWKLAFAEAHVRCWLKYKTPYGRAIMHMAYKKYTETFMYRKRLIELGEEFAFNTFVDSPFERKLFLSKLTWKDRLRAFFIPYNFINTGMLNRHMEF